MFDFDKTTPSEEPVRLDDASFQSHSNGDEMSDAAAPGSPEPAADPVDTGRAPAATRSPRRRVGRVAPVLAASILSAVLAAGGTAALVTGPLAGSIGAGTPTATPAGAVTTATGSG